MSIFYFSKIDVSELSPAQTPHRLWPRRGGRTVRRIAVSCSGSPFRAPSLHSEDSLDPKLGNKFHFEEIVAEIGTIVPFSRTSLDLFAFSHV
jgi:hypothetical protein